MHNVKGSLWISFWISDPENVKFGIKNGEKVWSLTFSLGIPIQIHFLGQTVCRGVKGTSINFTISEKALPLTTSISIRHFQQGKGPSLVKSPSQGTAKFREVPLTPLKYTLSRYEKVYEA